MILDIEGKEINVGDECIMMGYAGVYKVKIKKFTDAGIHYYNYNKTAQDYNTGYSEYCHKSGYRARMYKI